MFLAALFVSLSTCSVTLCLPDPKQVVSCHTLRSLFLPVRWLFSCRILDRLMPHITSLFYQPKFEPKRDFPSTSFFSPTCQLGLSFGCKGHYYKVPRAFGPSLSPWQMLPASFLFGKQSCRRRTCPLRGTFYLPMETLQKPPSRLSSAESVSSVLAFHDVSDSRVLIQSPFRKDNRQHLPLLFDPLWLSSLQRPLGDTHCLIIGIYLGLGLRRIFAPAAPPPFPVGPVLPLVESSALPF